MQTLFETLECFQGNSKAEDQKSFNLSPVEHAFLAFKQFMVYRRALLGRLKEQLFLFKCMSLLSVLQLFFLAQMNPLRTKHKYLISTHKAQLKQHSCCKLCLWKNFF